MEIFGLYKIQKESMEASEEAIAAKEN